jgi:AcrR family transcriptional regulator
MIQGDDVSHGKTVRRDKVETRELILKTFARMVVDDGVHDVSIQQVADRAGITHRTVYRHFASRQELIEELARWLDRRLAERGGIIVPVTIDQFPSAIAHNSRLFDEDAELVAALAIVTWGVRQPTISQQRRTESIANAMAPVTTHLNPAHATAVAAVARYLASSRTWLTFREEFGLTGAEAGPVIAWVVQTMIDALRDPANPGPGGARREETHDGE